MGEVKIALGFTIARARAMVAMPMSARKASLLGMLGVLASGLLMGVPAFAVSAPHAAISSPTAGCGSAGYSGPIGCVLVYGSDWAPSLAGLGDLNVYNNGTNLNHFGSDVGYTYQYQCTELAVRFADVVLHEGNENSWYNAGWSGAAQDMWRVGPSLPVPLQQIANGAGPPRLGDLLIFTESGGPGHVGVVQGVTGGRLYFVSENAYSAPGLTSIPINSQNVATASGFSNTLTVVGWLRGSGAETPTITDVSPDSGYVGAHVTITGTNLADATSVSFNGATANVASDTATQILTAVPIKATTGSISVTTPSGTATIPFTVVRATSWSLIGVTGNEEIYRIDSAGHAWEEWYSPSSGTWSSWFDLGSPTGQTLVGKPSVWASPVSGNEEVFARDTVGNYWEKWYSTNSGVWSPWTGLGSPGSALSSDPAVIEGVTGNEDVYGIDSAGHAWEEWYSPSSGTWSSWFDLGSLPLTVTSQTLPNGAKHVKYSVTLAADDGTAPYSWAVQSGKLPKGLHLNSQKGTISGKPKKSGTYTFTIQVSDTSVPTHETATEPLSITVP